MNNKTYSNKRFNIYLMYLIVFLQGFVFYGPVATLYRQGRGLSLYQIFLIESVFWILMIAFEIPWGWFADRYGYKKTLIISNIIFFISKIIFYKAFSFETFLIERVLLGIAISGLSGCDIALLYSSAPDGKSQKVFGIYNALATAGYLIASLISILIVNQSLYATAFYTIFPYGLAVILTFFLRDVKNNNEVKPNIINSFKYAWSKKHILLLVIAIALVREVHQSITVFLNQLQYIRSGIDIRYFGLIIVIIQLANLSAVKSYVLSKRFGKNKSIGMLISAIILCCLGLIFTNNAWLSIILVFIVSGSMSLINPIFVEIQNNSIAKGDRATILSIYAMVGNIVAAIINPFIGMSADISVETSFTTCIVIAICGYCFYVIYKRFLVTKRHEIS